MTSGNVDGPDADLQRLIDEGGWETVAWSANRYDSFEYSFHRTTEESNNVLLTVLLTPVAEQVTHVDVERWTYGPLDSSHVRLRNDWVGAGASAGFTREVLTSALQDWDAPNRDQPPLGQAEGYIDLTRTDLGGANFIEAELEVLMSDYEIARDDSRGMDHIVIALLSLAAGLLAGVGALLARGCTYTPGSLDMPGFWTAKQKCGRHSTHFSHLARSRRFPLLPCWAYSILCVPIT